MPGPTALQLVERVDLHGKEAIVTGGTGGIGRETARALARAGARVVVTGRDPVRGPEVAAALEKDADGGPVVFRPLDLASQASVRRWARGHVATGKPCHVLVDNAGVMGPPQLTRTDDGHELQFGTNHLGHFAFTVGLLDSLVEGARVVVLTSSAHRRGDVDLDDPDYRHRPYDPWQAYGQSKTANALFAVGAAARWAERGITVNAVMPGAVATGLQRHLTEADRAERGWQDLATGGLPPGFTTPEHGAATSVWAATAPDLATTTGAYLEDCAVARPWTEAGLLPRGHYLPYALDPDRAALLWELSTRMTVP